MYGVPKYCNVIDCNVYFVTVTQWAVFNLCYLFRDGCVLYCSTSFPAPERLHVSVITF